MDERGVQYLAEACGGTVVQPGSGAPFSRLCTDSRQVLPGDLFLALSGERFDAHAFVPDVVARGAAGVVVQTGKIGPQPACCAVAEVADVRRALGRLGRRTGSRASRA